MSAPPVINIDQIPPGEGLSLDLALDHAWLAGVLEGTEVTLASTGRSRARVRLDLDGRDVIVSGDLALRVAAECVACLSPVELDLATEFQLLLEPAGKRGKGSAHDEVEPPRGARRGRVPGRQDRPRALAPRAGAARGPGAPASP
ncbi:MAG: hypothetical protein U0325_21785 [Polyangiales bacterium]